MSIESERDLHSLRRIGRIVGLVLRDLQAQVRPGVTTAELDRLCAALLASHGAGSAPQRLYGFPGAICISVNEEAVHGVPGERRIGAGDLAKLDLVAERDGYIADAAITVTVPPVTTAHRQLAKCARRAFEQACAGIQAGRRIADIGRAVEGEARRCGFVVIRELGGHGVGRAIHEPPHIPNFPDGRDRTVLTDGLAIAVEPIIAAGSGQLSRRATAGQSRPPTAALPHTTSTPWS
jgi:methionyl aminopeptidase